MLYLPINELEWIHEWIRKLYKKMEWKNDPYNTNTHKHTERIWYRERGTEKERTNEIMNAVWYQCDANKAVQNQNQSIFRHMNIEHTRKKKKTRREEQIIEWETWNLIHLMVIPVLFYVRRRKQLKKMSSHSWKWVFNWLILSLIQWK